MIEYEDFALKIEPKRGDSYPVIVLRSPAGEGRSTFRTPFAPDEIGPVLLGLEQMVRGGGRSSTRDVSPAAPLVLPQQVGDQLFQALFSGTVRSLFDRSLGMIHGRERGLRIKLHIDPEDPDLAQLASLPWEFLYHKETRDFLNLSRFTPIVRYLDVQRPYAPLPLELPLRILVVISSPSDYARLDLSRERKLIEESWAQQEGVQVEFVEQATVLKLQERLAEQPYHVLHYMGHGDFDEDTGRGVLLLEDEAGRGVMVDGSTLDVLLSDVPSLRLVFLNACETARATREKGRDPFAGVASALVMAGVPAVVAMQFPITDDAAIAFAQRFYPLLARGYPVDAAVAEGRRTIRLADPETMEWGTPVLFMRSPQGVVFQVSEAERAKLPAPEEPPDEGPPGVGEKLSEPGPGLPKWALAIVGGGLALIVVIALLFLGLSQCAPGGGTTPSPTTVTGTPTRTAFSTVAVVPTKTAFTPSPAPCAVEPSRFHTVWQQSRDRLGCLRREAVSLPLAEQTFEHGRMIWDSGTKEIYVLLDSGTWQVFDDTFQEGDLESDKTLKPPLPTLRQPQRGFGKVWREQLGGPEAAIGWALERERSVPNGWRQSFDHGLLVWTDTALTGASGGTAFLLYDDATWQAVPAPAP